MTQHSAIRRRPWRRVLTALALAGALGCSTLPTAPRLTNRAASPQAAASGAASLALPAPLPTLTLPPGVAPSMDTTATASDSLESIKLITGDYGGEVKAGRFDVAMPAGCFLGSAVVSVRVDGSDAMKCELGITPASANGFAKPALLRADCSDVQHVERMGIVWLNEATGAWEEVEGSTTDPATGIVSAPLLHFSHYAVAEVIRESKAGW